MFDPTMIEQKARAAGAHGESSFVWGYSFDPSADDARTIQFRVHVADSQPRSIEIFVRLRKADGTASEPKSISFAWPA